MTRIRWEWLVLNILLKILAKPGTVACAYNPSSSGVSQSKANPDKKSETYLKNN
jgi:hypothetical protein